jgi:putative spermidine/putrescine transport system ATP-binding protein
MAFLELHDIVKSFGRNTVVRGLSLNVEKGEFVSLLGGSGCGKTTTLRMIAGFEEPDEGRVLIDGKEVGGVAPNRRKLGMVFQNYALFPNMNVRRNIAFGLKIAGKDRAAIEKRVDEMLEVIHMEEFALRYPHQLSGGQQQRVALARALAIEPRALLLDEPLSALDAKIRLRLRDDIRSIQQRLGITTIYVTHDQEEALSISDRVAVMKEGLIEQIGTPFEIYNHPATPYVAGFIGTSNLLEATVLDQAGGLVELGGQSFLARAPLPAPAGTRLSLSLRPEAVTIEGVGGEAAALSGEAAALRGEGSETSRLKGRVLTVKFLGSVVRFVVEVADCRIFADCFNAPRLSVPRVGEEVFLRFARESCAPSAVDAAVLREASGEEEEA